MSPTIFRSGPYRFFFYSGDHVEPPHIHVQKDARIAKFWLKPVRLQSSGGFRPNEICRIQRIIEKRESDFLEYWHEYFDD